MNILGISGFENSMPFKRAHWPSLDEREYRISQGHDAAAALVIDGQIVAAAAEERFNREKHSGRFPLRAIEYCLSEAGLALEDVDELAHGFDYEPFEQLFSLDPVASELYREVYSREALLRLTERDLDGFPADRVHHVGHHLAHAASAYFTSGFDECMVVVIDGMGEVVSATVYRASAKGLEKIHEISAAHSIGILYSLVTLHLGFNFGADEYKIMGLAPYGDPEQFRAFFERAIDLRSNGSIRIPPLALNQTREERENHLGTRRHLTEHLGPPRMPDDPITDDHRDIAAALQARLDQAMGHLCGYFGRQTGLRKLAMAGGVALNCTSNGNLLRSSLFDDIYIQPAAGDDGSALGAALYRASLCDGDLPNRRFPVPFLGPAPTPDAIESAISEMGDRIKVERFDGLEPACERAAELIRDGRVLAWYRGRMEFGPRALGHRSILADPGHPGMRDRINSMVKMREAFRPFAPAVTIEQVHRWFDVPPMTELAYMIITADVRREHRAQLPAVTHVNGSARVQTVSSDNNASFHTLLSAVGRATGREMVLNTSFNVKGQPIVNTPTEALETFLGTGIEFLFLENTLISRSD
jgi:carbamoyltransferase